MEILIKKLIKHLKLINERLDKIEEKIDERARPKSLYSDKGDVLLSEAIDLVAESQMATASFLQRQMNIGYARAARLLDLMEERGVVGPSRGAESREILIQE